MTRARPPFKTWLRRLSLLLLVGSGGLSGCLEPTQVEHYPRSCLCQGVSCVAKMVRRYSYPEDPEADPCLVCDSKELGRCAEGCGTAPHQISGCPVAYACKTWDRVKPGAPCSQQADCEPGEVDGKPSNTLVCNQGVCADFGAVKWAGPVRAAKECAGEPWHGAHPSCGANACLSPEIFGKRRFCSVARCLTDSDCPEHWFCRCDEEVLTNGELTAQRWCVPNLEGFPEEAILPLDP